MSNTSTIIDLISFLGLNYTILNLGLCGYWLPENTPCILIIIYKIQIYLLRNNDFYKIK